MIAAAAVGWLR